MVNSSTDGLILLRSHLESLQGANIPLQAFIGFDGFVDKIQKAVRTRETGKGPVFFKSITEFSEHLQTLSGKSGQVELVTSRVKAGGNAPLFANALANLQVKCICVGSVGSGEPDPVFKAFSCKVELIPALAPGQSQAIEFDDGKIILSDLQAFYQYDWNQVCSRIDVKRITDFVRSSSVVGLVDWANLPHATDIWRGFLQDTIKPSGRTDFRFLFDLCDPTKKSSSAVKEVLSVINSYSAYGSVTLGLNENEARKVWSILQQPETNANPGATPPGLSKIAADIFQSMKVDTVLVHPIDRVVICRSGGCLEIPGHVVSQPRVQTGAGDNLNAGYTFGLANGMSVPQSALMGIVVAGCYVQNGDSPKIKDLIEYINQWLGGGASNEAHHSEVRGYSFHRGPVKGPSLESRLN